MANAVEEVMDLGNASLGASFVDVKRSANSLADQVAKVGISSQSGCCSGWPLWS